MANSKKLTVTKAVYRTRDQGANDQRMREIIADGFREVYFQDDGRRASDLREVEMKDIDYLDLGY